MLKQLKNTIKEKKFAKSQAYLFKQKGSLLNAFSTSKTIFIHIPKTAGMSLAQAIYGDVVGSAHRKVSFFRYILEKELDDYFKFCFVRDPYDRLYSAYKFLEKGGVNQHDKRAFDKFLSRYKNFEDFVINGLSNKVMNEIIHLVPQIDFICDKKGEILVDYIGKFENLQIEIKTLSEKLNKEIILSHLNLNKKKSFDKVFTDKMRKRVRKLYAKDFEILGY